MQQVAVPCLRFYSYSTNIREHLFLAHELCACTYMIASVAPFNVPCKRVHVQQELSIPVYKCTSFSSYDVACYFTIECTLCVCVRTQTHFREL